jgi:hypothetical protein
VTNRVIAPTMTVAGADWLGTRTGGAAAKDHRNGGPTVTSVTARLENACVALQVDDTDNYYREWSSKVNVLRLPKDEEWGARTFDLLDPSGNTIFVMGPVTGAK